MVRLCNPAGYFPLLTHISSHFLVGKNIHVNPRFMAPRPGFEGNFLHFVQNSDESCCKIHVCSRPILPTLFSHTLKSTWMNSVPFNIPLKPRLHGRFLSAIFSSIYVIEEANLLNVLNSIHQEKKIVVLELINLVSVLILS